MRRVITLVLKLAVDDSIEGRVTNREAADHVRDAVAQWGGQLYPECWQWPDNIRVTVKARS